MLLSAQAALRTSGHSRRLQAPAQLRMVVGAGIACKAAASIYNSHLVS